MLSLSDSANGASSGRASLNLEIRSAGAGDGPVIYKCDGVCMCYVGQANAAACFTANAAAAPFYECACRLPLQRWQDGVHTQVMRGGELCPESERQ